jgi:hypothetical protein
LTADNPQTDTPDSLGKIRGLVSPTATIDKREQIRRYIEQMGSEALARQMRLGREDRYRNSKW